MKSACDSIFQHKYSMFLLFHVFEKGEKNRDEIKKIEMPSNEDYCFSLSQTGIIK